MTTEELNNYSRAAVKKLLTGDATTGKKVFQDIHQDPNLTPEEKQQVCCVVGQLGLKVECQRVIENKNPGTLLRANTSIPGFIGAYLNVHAKSYFEEVRDKTIPSVLGDGSSLEVAKDITDAFVEKAGTLSPQAAEFLKVTVDVIKSEMPDHAPQLIPTVLSSNLVLRGGMMYVTNWTQYDPTNKEALNTRSSTTNDMDEIRNQVRDLSGKVGGKEKLITELEEDIKKVTTRVEKQVLEKQLQQVQNELKPLREKLDSENMRLAPLIKEQQEKNELLLAPHQERIERLENGMLAIAGVQALSNQINGRVERNEIGQELQSDNGLMLRFKQTLGNIGDGKVKGLEVGKVTLPEVDLEDLQEEIKEERRVAEQKKLEEKKEAVEVPVLEEVEGLEEGAKAKVDPDTDPNRLKRLEDKLTLLKGQPLVPGEEGKPYKPTALEKFKAIFTKGGMDTVLERKEERLIAQIDAMKLKIFQKEDPAGFEKMVEQNRKSVEELNKGLEATQRAADFYVAAQLEVEAIDRQLQMDAALNNSGLAAPMTSEEKMELLEMREEAMGVMQVHQNRYEQHLQHEFNKLGLEKTISVREQLQAANKNKPQTKGQTVEQSKTTKKSTGVH